MNPEKLLMAETLATGTTAGGRPGHHRELRSQPYAGASFLPNVGAERASRIVIPIRPHVTSVERRPWQWVSLAKWDAVGLLRFSLAGVFLWFGLLKLADVSPVVDLLKASFPFLAASPYLEILGLAEILIALGLVIKPFSKQATVLMILHLLGTLSVVLISPRLIFAPRFPILTMDGEFVTKNIVLIVAGLVIIFSREK